MPVGCVVNPRAGKELQTEFGPAKEPKKILIAGAGPAGCELAVTAAMRGHKVILCDKQDHIGGQVHWGAPATGKHDFHYLFDYYRAALPKYGVELRTGVEVTAELVKKEKPDVVVVATGAAPFKPPIAAVEAPNVHQAWEVLQGNADTGADVVVVGGGSVGLETAVSLAAKGTISPEQLYFLALHDAESPEVLRDLMVKGVKKVTVIEMQRRMAQDVGPSTRWVLLKELEIRGINLVTEARMKDIQQGRVVYTDSQGKDVTIPADSVILAMGSRPENSLAKSLEQAGIDNVRVIGDANKIGRIGDALDSGFALACEL
jgi:2,4-dienoyl-CoA reductase (NADPH2)